MVWWNERDVWTRNYLVDRPMPSKALNNNNELENYLSHPGQKHHTQTSTRISNGRNIKHLINLVVTKCDKSVWSFFHCIESAHLWQLSHIHIMWRRQHRESISAPLPQSIIHTICSGQATISTWDLRLSYSCLGGDVRISRVARVPEVDWILRFPGHRASTFQNYR